MLPTTIVRTGCLCFVLSIPLTTVFGFEEGVTGNLEVARYLLRATEAMEQSAARSKGRMRARFIRRDGPKDATVDRLDMETTVECVWDGANSFRKITEVDFGLHRRLQKEGGLKESKPKLVRFRVLSTPERWIRVHDGEDPGAKASSVSIWPSQRVPESAMDWLVLPGENALKHAFQIDLSSILKFFVEPPVDLQPKPIRKIVEDGKKIVLSARYPEGGEFEMTFSPEWDDRMVAYRAKPDGRSISLKQTGTITWNRDIHGEIHLQEHTYEFSDPGTRGSYGSTWTLKVEEFDSRPVIAPREFTLEGFDLPDDAIVYSYSHDPSAAVSIRTVGGGPIPVDDRSEEKAFESLVEQLKSRGFARPERTK